MKNWKTLRLVLGLAAALVLVYCGVNAALVNDAQWAKNLLVYSASAETGDDVMVTTSAPLASSEELPQYTPAATYDKTTKTVTGTATLKEGEAPSRLFARVTFFFADGTYNVGAVSVYNGEFETQNSGNAIHISVQITNSVRIVPGSYERFGGIEFDVE